MRTVGVTGGAGFIGGWVVDRLREKGYEVIVFDHSGRKARDGVEVMLGDIRDDVAMTELAAHVDGIIHLAAVLGTQETITNPRPAALTNVQGGLNFLEAITQYDLPGVNICVGNHWMNNSYSISKTCVERFGRMFADERGTRINQVRCVNAYGPRQRVAAPFGPGKVRKITPAFVCRALSGMPIEIYGDGHQVSDMVHVSDVAEVLVRALERASIGTVFDRTVEVGPAQSATVNEVAGLIGEFASHYTGVRQPLEHLAMRPGEIAGDKVTANVSTLELVGIQPDEMIGLPQGMSETVAWYWRHRDTDVWSMTGVR